MATLTAMPTALVTGASSGIGLAIATDLLAAGWDVSSVSRSPERADLAGAHPIRADLAREQDCLDAVAAHRERFGALDLLVNSSGVSIREPVDACSTEHWDAQFDLNVRGLFLVTRSALPMLRESRGLVVNIASMSGLRAPATLSAYAASKHAVVGFTRALVEELAPDGVRATAICPGYVATPMTENTQRRIPAETMIQPEDIAATVRWLLALSPRCVVPEVPMRMLGG